MCIYQAWPKGMLYQGLPTKDPCVFLECRPWASPTAQSTPTGSDPTGQSCSGRHMMVTSSLHWGSPARLIRAISVHQRKTKNTLHIKWHVHVCIHGHNQGRLLPSPPVAGVGVCVCVCGRWGSDWVWSGLPFPFLLTGLGQQVLMLGSGHPMLSWTLYSLNSL